MRTGGDKRKEEEGSSLARQGTANQPHKEELPTLIPQGRRGNTCTPARVCVSAGVGGGALGAKGGRGYEGEVQVILEGVCWGDLLV